jgi:ectoine hydroxylase-related dioxygenase (phytanoyl-CoA dioxygenase family)
MFHTSQVIAAVPLTLALAGFLPAVGATAVSDTPGTGVPAHCAHPDPRYLPHTPDAVEAWLARCPTTGHPRSADGAENWLAHR